MGPDDTIYRGRVRQRSLVTHNRDEFVRFTIDIPATAIEDGSHLLADEFALRYESDDE